MIMTYDWKSKPHERDVVTGEETTLVTLDSMTGTKSMVLYCSHERFVGAETKFEESRDSMLIQNVFPFLTADEREFLITGLTPGEWNILFNGTED